MKSSTSANTVIPTDQQGREELHVIFDNVDTAILPHAVPFFAKIVARQDCSTRQVPFQQV